MDECVKEWVGGWVPRLSGSLGGQVSGSVGGQGCQPLVTYGTVTTVTVPLWVEPLWFTARCCSGLRRGIHRSRELRHRHGSTPLIACLFVCRPESNHPALVFPNPPPRALRSTTCVIRSGEWCGRRASSWLLARLVSSSSLPPFPTPRSLPTGLRR